MDSAQGMSILLGVGLAMASSLAVAQPHQIPDSQSPPPGSGAMPMSPMGAGGWGAMGGPPSTGPMLHPGMMNGGGPGMLGNIWALNLSEQQRERIRELQRRLRDQHWEKMKGLMESSDRLEELYSQWPLQVEKIDEVYETIFAARRQLIIDQLKLRNQVYDLLTDDQRAQLRRMAIGGAPSTDTR